MNKISGLIISFIKTRWLNKFNTREKLEKYQKKKIEKYLKFLKKKSPYFKENYISEGFRMDKKFMMENFDSLNTLGIKKEKAMEIALENERTRNFTKKYGRISVGLSSGTSGHRGIFVTTEKEQGIWAGTILAKMLPEKKLFGHKIAFFLRADNDLYKSVNSPVLKLEYFDTFKNIDSHAERLNIFKPTILIAPASMLLLLCKAKKSGKLDISPEKIISVAEILEKEDEKYIREIFNVNQIHQVYQATEGFLGYTCRYGSIHLNEDIIKFEKEYIDDKRFYPIITDFTRTSQPFVKYRLNDILVESSVPCKCGLVYEKIEKIEGRSDDIFRFINKNGKTVIVFPDFIRRCMILAKNIREYKVFQTDYNYLEIAIQNLQPDQKKEILKEFGNLFSSINVENVNIKFIEYKTDKYVKLKRICRKIK
ncbi:CoF synthetase [Leptotrichia sp. OH3620_COT-345]|uniref:F390 synthetase-related protein n=1 Tax=Leptotrichia sp. OH3620_COT-345 TaxID=2491048 RepID=UPI000F65385B|nr:F390 synthetase-related protein [Leptotrichia sp. OH3620_COT-345]RRD39551.1 CoF synthetase [Leptotrichia sp. OH3620_COT-345]